MSALSEVWHYDGESGVRHLVPLRIDGDNFDLGEGTERHPLTALLPREQAGEYGLKGRPGWRIGGVPNSVRAALPQPARYGGGIIDRIGLWPAAAGFAVVAAVALFAFLQFPALVARAVPVWMEARLGQLMVGDLGRRGCSSPEGRAALDTLAERIGAGPDIRVHVVRLPLVNAATLPGGQIVLFDGLVQSARSPDEVAGVLGHEIGHVRNRDVMEGLLRQFGLSILLGGMEGQVGSYTNALLATSYSRDAERRADRYAIALLDEAKVAPDATADFFARTAGVGKRKGGPGRVERVLGYLGSHPDPAERAKAFVKAKRRDATYTPALDAGDWAALRNMCRASPVAADPWNF